MKVGAAVASVLEGCPARGWRTGALRELTAETVMFVVDVPDHRSRHVKMCHCWSQVSGMA